MLPDDPRHGTVAGYNRIPCRDECCKFAMAQYKKRWQWDLHNGRVRRVSTIGTRRRIESLAWLGWSRMEIATRAGMHPTNMTRLLTAETMTAALAARFAAVYEELCMTMPTGNAQAIANVRKQARKRGAVSPLAWDDIDDTNEQPKHDVRAPRDSVQLQLRLDMAVVWRLVDEGTRVRQLTAAEAREAYRILVGRGLTTHEIEKRYGLNSERYGKEAA